jgi:hypothetical protein
MGGGQTPYLAVSAGLCMSKVRRSVALESHVAVSLRASEV